MSDKAAREKQRRTQQIVVYCVFGAVIALLTFYLVFRRTERVRYDVPDTPTIAEERIDTIVVRSVTNKEIEIRRQGEAWVILPNEYKVDSKRIDEMLESLASFEITELVSEAENYALYDLDEDSRFDVRALDSGNSIVEFAVGKRSPSYNHTYVTLPGDTKIYQAPGNLLDAFNKDSSGLRDKHVFQIDPDTIARIGVTTPDESFRLYKSIESSDESTSESVRWKSDDENEWDPEAIESALGRLKDLSCQRYVEDDVDLGSPSLVLELQGEETHQFFLFDKVDSSFRARSSQTPYAFEISSYQAEQIIETFVQTSAE